MGNYTQIPNSDYTDTYSFFYSVTDGSNLPMTISNATYENGFTKQPPCFNTSETPVSSDSCYYPLEID